MKKENYGILEKYMRAYDEAHLNDWEDHCKERGWDKEGDENWERFLEDRAEDFELRAVTQRRWYKHTVQKAIEAKEKGETYPMFNLVEEVN